MPANGLEKASHAAKDDAPAPDMVDSVITAAANERSETPITYPIRWQVISLTKTASLPQEAR